MARPIDFSALTRAERLVLASGALGLANGMFPWWYRATTSQGTYTYNSGLHGWGVVAVLAGAAAALGALARAWIWPRSAPRHDGTAYLVLATIALASLSGEVGARGSWIGVWVALALALALGAAALARRAERRRGWS